MDYLFRCSVLCTIASSQYSANLATNKSSKAASFRIGFAVKLSELIASLCGDDSYR